MIRCKMTLNSITRSPYRKYIGGDKYEDAEIVSFKMNPVMGPAGTENAEFFASTPSGVFEVASVNPKAVAELSSLLGREFYIDLSLAPLPSR